MRTLRKMTLFALLVATYWTASAADGKAPGTDNSQLNGGSAQITERAKKILEDPLGGVIVNRTITVQGHDFYRYFAQWWREKDEENKYSISIHERPSARWGSEIWVQYRRDRVFHIFLPPARSQTKEISKQAVNIVYENITRNELQRALFKSEDLGPEEM